MDNENNYKRPSWDEYFMKIVNIIGSRATCDRGRSGCIIVKNRIILSTGYVGSPIGLPHCDDIGHEIHTVTHADGNQSNHCIRTTHAEQNAICQAAKIGTAIDGATMYVKMTPCYACAKMIINSGIKRVVCQNDYHAGQRSKEIFIEAGIKFNLINQKMEEYDNMQPENEALKKPENEKNNINFINPNK